MPKKPKNKILPLGKFEVLSYFLRKRGCYLIKATILAQELFEDVKKAENWMMASNSYFGHSPFEVILMGEGIHVLRFLEERLGRKPGAGF